MATTPYSYSYALQLSELSCRKFGCSAVCVRASAFEAASGCPSSTLECIEILPFSKSAIKRSGNFKLLKTKPALFSALERFAAPFQGWSVEINTAGAKHRVLFSPLHLGPSHAAKPSPAWLTLSTPTPDTAFLATAFGFVSVGTALLRTRSVGMTCRASELLR